MADQTASSDVAGTVIKEASIPVPASDAALTAGSEEVYCELCKVTFKLSLVRIAINKVSLCRNTPQMKRFIDDHVNEML